MRSHVFYASFRLYVGFAVVLVLQTGSRAQICRVVVAWVTVNMIYTIRQPLLRQQKYDAVHCVMFALPSDVLVAKQIAFDDNFVPNVSHT
jgi:hypothetical protein